MDVDTHSTNKRNMRCKPRAACKHREDPPSGLTSVREGGGVGGGWQGSGGTRPIFLELRGSVIAYHNHLSASGSEVTLSVMINMSRQGATWGDGSGGNPS